VYFSILFGTSFVGTDKILRITRKALAARHRVMRLICTIILPADNLAVQYFIAPFPLPIRSPNDLAVTGISGLHLNQIFCFSFFFLTVKTLRRACSNCFGVKRPLLRIRNPTYPCCTDLADSRYWHFLMVPLCNRLNFVRLGCHLTSIGFNFYDRLFFFAW